MEPILDPVFISSSLSSVPSTSNYGHHSKCNSSKTSKERNAEAEVIKINLSHATNSFIKIAINNWINLLTPVKVAEWIINKYNAYSVAERKRRIRKQDVNAVVDQWIQRNGTDSYEINKTLLDAYIYYSSCKLLEKPTHILIAPERQSLVLLERMHHCVKSMV